MSAASDRTADRTAGARAVAQALAQARRAVALTGAGVSTEVGIPDFRSDQGVWARADPMEVGSIHGFLADPARFYAFWDGFFSSIGDVRPGSAHRLLAALEARGLLSTVVTQNIDGLHQAAGSRSVIEVHGSWKTARCRRCGAREETRAILDDVKRRSAPSCLECGGLMKPEVILFGEALGTAMERATGAVDAADFLIVLGSSLSVAPVSDLVPQAAARGIPIAIVNREPTTHDDLATFVVRSDLKDAVAVISSALGLPISR